jgi:hypothetical protein
LKSLIHCIYASAAKCHFGDSELAALLSKARNVNEGLGISGMLLHVDGSFFQVLEGEAEKVDMLFAKIALDSRHAKVTVIIREPIARRSFGNWTMGYSTMTEQEVAGIVGQNDFFANASCLASLDNRRAKKLLTAFGKGRWRSALDGATELSPVAA